MKRFTTTQYVQMERRDNTLTLFAEVVQYNSILQLQTNRMKSYSYAHVHAHTLSFSPDAISYLCNTKMWSWKPRCVHRLNSTFAVCMNVGSASCKHLKIHTVGKRLRFCLFLPSIAIKAAYRRWDKEKYLYMCTEKTQDNFTLNTFFVFFFFLLCITCCSRCCVTRWHDHSSRNEVLCCHQWHLAEVLRSPSEQTCNIRQKIAPEAQSHCKAVTADESQWLESAEQEQVASISPCTSHDLCTYRTGILVRLT